MSSFDAYEHNLQTRLLELRRGDRAYEIHGDAILETLPYIAFDAPDYDIRRILDVGCGLGFLALKLAEFPETEVIGIDPSKKAIAIARQEHAGRKNLAFYTDSAEEFPATMKERGIPPFERAILNMVLHSVDDETCLAILGGVKQSLDAHGVLTCIVPGQDWLIQKLIEKAKDEGMNRGNGIAWVKDQINQGVIDLAVSISGQPAYAEPITIYNRSLEDYGELLRAGGYGLKVEVVDPATGETQNTIDTPYWEWSDHTNGYELSTRDRHILMTQTE